MLPSAWKPVLSGPAVRVGSRHDGGYVVTVAAIDRTDVLVGMGLNDDWSFEAAFRERSPARIICFDHSVTSKFWLRHIVTNLARFRFAKATRFLSYRRFFKVRDIEHRPLKIGVDGPGSISFRTIMRDLGDVQVFLKMDIEGSEYRVFDDIVANASQLTGLAIELHDVDLHRSRIKSFFEAMSDFEIIHIHGNNYGDIDGNGDPVVLEVAMTRRDLLGRDGQSWDALGTPNDPGKPDLELAFG